ncbi:RNA pseudouridine synthase 4, mitochondrial [Macadamia integrifolia]|uniref:RNA pseudouridine synthase 4, mitochondrial n=1 Tax=Macadamia integrifolia TaxID=60698 RepID=UPI001C4E6771|nr:RNA pseudouridine synthase 4, mitochondrial [Macadamia integrifolia]
MLELILRRRSSLPTPTKQASTKLCIYILFQLRLSFSTATAVSTEEKERTVEKGKWLTLPPFTSTIDAASVAKELSGRRSDRNGEGGSSTTDTTTALKWVLRCCPNIPRSLVQKLFRLRQVRRESFISASASEVETEAQVPHLRRVSAKDALNAGDQIFLPITVQELATEKHECPCSEDEISYIRSLELYKDPAIIVINKPCGMPVQGGIGIKKSLDEIAATCLRYDYSEPPRLVHRLDRDSSGILVMGRTQMSATVLHSIFREKTFGASLDGIESTKRTIQRKYWALVIGTPRRSRGLISASLGKVVMDNGKSDRITIANNDKIMSSQHAVTQYRVIQPSLHGLTWIELCPLTGRKHQLRVHCAEFLRTPIVGDYKYGWQAHKKWNPIPWSNPEKSFTEMLPKRKMVPFGINLLGGSISEDQPHLHLHCGEMSLPNVSLALHHMQSSSHCDLSELDSLSLSAPLPPHMQRSWDILSN